MTTLQNSENIEEQVKIDELSQVLNSTESSSSKLSMSRGADFCTTYNQIKSYIAPIISLLYKGADLRILPSSWRNILRNAAQLIELLKQFCDETCSSNPTPAWAVMGDETISSVGVSSWKSEVMDLFVRGTDNQLYYKWYDSNNGGWKQGYEPLGGQISFSPVAVSGGGSDLIDVFARGIGSSDGVYHKIWQGGVWSDWQRLGSMDTLSGPGVSWEPGRHLGVFVRGTDNALYCHQYNPNNGWVGPWPLDGQISSSPAAIALVNGPVHVFARGMDNALWHRWYDGGWQNWESLGGPLGGQISSDPESGPSVSSWGPQRMDVVVRGTDNAVWHRCSDDGGVRWSDWASLGGDITSAPASISRAPNQLEVFARGTDSKLYHIWWDGTAWHP